MSSFIRDVVGNLQEIDDIVFGVKKKDNAVEIYLKLEDGSESTRSRFLVCSNNKSMYTVYSCGFIKNHLGDCYDRNSPMTIRKKDLFALVEKEFKK